LAQQSLENPYDKFCGQLAPFMCARSKLTESADVSFYSQSTSEVAQRALRENKRVKNALTKALQTKEQRGHIRGVSSMLTWKEGFPEHKSIY
jgi:hypothetical protein